MLIKPYIPTGDDFPVELENRLRELHFQQGEALYDMVNQCCAQLMSEWSESVVAARWIGDLRTVLLENKMFDATAASLYHHQYLRTILHANNRDDMLLLAIFAMKHLLGDLPDYDIYASIGEETRGD